MSEEQSDFSVALSSAEDCRFPGADEGAGLGDKGTEAQLHHTCVSGGITLYSVIVDFAGSKRYGKRTSQPWIFVWSRPSLNLRRKFLKKSSASYLVTFFASW